MYWNVSVRPRNGATHFHSEDIEGQMQLEAFVKRWQAEATEKGEQYDIDVASRVHTIPVDPKPNGMPTVQEETQALPYRPDDSKVPVKNYQPPKTDDSPSVCEILGRGD